MRSIALALLSLITACGCTSSPTTTLATTAAAAAPSTATCDSIHGHLVELYRTEAMAKEPARVAAATADNVTMAEHECLHAASTFPACANAAVSAAEFESKCMPKLDDEGSEGDHFTAPRVR